MSELTIKSWANMPAATEITDTDNFLVLNEEGALGKANCEEVLAEVPMPTPEKPAVYYLPINNDTSEYINFEDKFSVWADLDQMLVDCREGEVTTGVSLQSVLRQAYNNKAVRICIVPLTYESYTLVRGTKPIIESEILGVIPCNQLAEGYGYEALDPGITTYYKGYGIFPSCTGTDGNNDWYTTFTVFNLIPWSVEQELP